jgi:hypothetical protein
MRMSYIANESYATAKEKGWWDESVPRSNAILHFLMCSELSEALEDFRAHKGVTESWLENGTKPCGIPSEAGDLIIRIGDLAGKMNLTFGTHAETGTIFDELGEPSQECGIGDSIFCSDILWSRLRQPLEFDEAMMTANARVSWVYVYGKDLTPTQLAYAYWRICNDIVVYFDEQGYDLRTMIQQKMEFNKTRPIRHGNKKV